MNCRATAWAQKNTDLRFRSMTSSQSFSLKLMASSRRMMPALLTRMSMRPVRPGLLDQAFDAAGVDRLARRSRKRAPAPRLRRACRSGALTLTPTMSAPACASASAMPWPRPVLQPVTMATRPASIEIVERHVAHSSAGHGHMVHVLEHLVLAHHAPDEGVGLGAHAAVDRPARADHRLLVAHHQVARLGGLAHHVEDHGVVRHVEVEIHLHAPVVGVAGHGVPQAARLELGHAHQQLAGRQHVGHHELVDGAAVAGLGAPRVSGLKPRQRDLATSGSGCAPARS
jgi:hypothetical protein